MKIPPMVWNFSESPTEYPKTIKKPPVIGFLSIKKEQEKMKIKKASKKNCIVAMGVFDTAFIRKLNKDKDSTANIYIIEYDSGNIVFSKGVGMDTLSIVVCVTSNQIHLNALLYDDLEEIECTIDLTREELIALAAYLLTKENTRKGKGKQ